MTPAPALDLTTSLRGDFQHILPLQGSESTICSFASVCVRAHCIIVTKEETHVQ